MTRSWNCLDEAIHAHVEAGGLRGTIIAHAPHDEPARVVVRGDLRRDSLIRIASLTKPVAACAALRCVEDGWFELDDPVERWLPELASRQVLMAPDAPLDAVRPACRPILVEDLLTMRMGLGTLMRREAVPLEKAMYERSVGVDIALEVTDRDDWLARVGGLPLFYDPGTAWLYDTSMVALGALLERAMNQPLARVIEDRVLAPLGMDDTGFSIAPDDCHRLPEAYAGQGDTRRVVEPAAAESRFARPAGFASAAAGLVSTVDDYLRFGRMLAGRGEGLLRPETFAAMAQDRILPEHQATSFGPGFWTSFGFGYGIGVVRRHGEHVPRGLGWDGGYGTTAWSDPVGGTSALFFTQRMMDGPGLPTHFETFWRHFPWEG